MSRLWIDARLLLFTASAPSHGLQTESANDADAAVYRLRLFWIHKKRSHGPAPTQAFHPAGLSLDVARAANLLLDFSQHVLVSVRLLKDHADFDFIRADLSRESRRTLT